VDADGDGVPACLDCDDSNNLAQPGGTELCDGADNDCDGAVDEEGGVSWYTDSDGDGFGDDTSVYVSCISGPGDVSLGGDCDDTLANVYPGAAESCDGLDNDCDGSIDEDIGSVWYTDSDGDGFGDDTSSHVSCIEGPEDVSVGGDCEDSDAGIYPGALEVCDGVDQDCDGLVDEDSVDMQVYYADVDGDGFGDANAPVSSCSQPSGYVSDSTDCDDSSTGIYPGAIELCNGVDEDCDGLVDEDAVDAASWFEDTDGDGYGGTSSVLSCTQPSGYVAAIGDCDDSDAAYNPGATEVCTDPRDLNCDGVVGYVDADGDGFAACAECDDGNTAVYPGALELCNGVDDDCDGTVDMGAAGAVAWYQDADGDGFGDSSSVQYACTQPVGFVADFSDCEDSNAAINPAEVEICNGVDDNCDGVIDTDAVDRLVWYQDSDGDGFGDVNSPVEGCTQPAGSVSDTSDCEDNDAAIYPGAIENCNGVDDNCDGASDETESWWDSGWPYRLLVEVQASSVDVAGAPVLTEVDFRAALDALGDSSAFDADSLRVVLQDCGAGQPELPSQFLDEYVGILEKLEEDDPVDELGTVAFLYDTDGDYGTLETFAANSTITVGLYFGGSPGIPSYTTGLVATSSSLSNGTTTATLDSTHGGLLSSLSFQGSPSLQSQTTSCCGNSFYGGSWGIDPQNGAAGAMEVLFDGPVIAAVESTGSRADGQSGYDYSYQYLLFAGRPELWIKVHQVTTRSSTLAHPADITYGIRPYEARADAISGSASFTTDPNWQWGDVSNSSWGVMFSYVTPPVYVITMSNYNPYIIVSGNDYIGFGAGTPYVIPAGVAYMDHIVQLLLPHTGSFGVAHQETVEGLIQGVVVVQGSPEAL
jgi:hypothetical protein